MSSPKVVESVTSYWVGDALFWNINGVEVSDRRLKEWCYANLPSPWNYMDTLRWKQACEWAKANAPILSRSTCGGGQ